MEANLLVLAAALCFFYVSLSNLMTWAFAPPPARPVAPFIIFIYCLFAGLILLYKGGFLQLHGMN